MHSPVFLSCEGMMGYSIYAHVVYGVPLADADPDSDNLNEIEALADERWKETTAVEEQFGVEFFQHGHPDVAGYMLIVKTDPAYMVEWNERLKLAPLDEMTELVIIDGTQRLADACTALGVTPIGEPGWYLVARWS